MMTFDDTKIQDGDGVVFTEDDGSAKEGTVVDTATNRIKVEWTDDYPTSWVSLSSHSLKRVGTQERIEQATTQDK